MTKTTSAKDANLVFVSSNLAGWLANAALRNKFVVVHNRALAGTFDTFAAALRFAVANFPQNEFVVQQVIDEREVISFIRAAC